MLPPFPELFEGSDHEQVQLIQEPSIGLYAVLAIHDTRGGPAFGGIRRLAYRSIGEAIRDALRLSEAMTQKCLMARVPGGGGKGVVVDHPGLDLTAAYRLIGRYVENLGGRFYTGPDVGTGDAELLLLRDSTRFVTVPGSEGPGDLAAATARGVLAGLHAVLSFLERSDSLSAEFAEHTFAVQGLGSVGYLVAQALAQAGAQVTAADPISERAARARDELGIEVIHDGDLFDLPCDVFVPCALGGILHDLTIERLRCRAVAGSANNLLASPEHAASLASRGILVAPDYVINSGALILGANFHLTGGREHGAAIDAIGDELFELFGWANSEGIPPPVLADRIAADRLRKRRSVASFFPEPFASNREDPK